MRWAEFSRRHAERSHHTGIGPQPGSEHLGDSSGVEGERDTATDLPPHSALAAGLAAALRDPENTPFPVIVVRLFQQAEPEDRAEILGRLLSVRLGPLGSDLAGLLGAGRKPKPDDTLRIPVETVRALAEQAQRMDPGVIDAVGEFLADHPRLAKMLDIRTLSIAIAYSAERRGGDPTA